MHLHNIYMYKYISNSTLTNNDKEALYIIEFSFTDCASDRIVIIVNAKVIFSFAVDKILIPFTDVLI